MNIFYIASVRIPSEKASGLAILRQCEAFAKLGHAVTVLRPYRTNHITDDPFTYYGIPEIFSIRTIPSLDFKIWLGKIGFYIARLSQMLVGICVLYTHRKEIDVIYARDPWMLVLPVLFFKRPKIIWEAHQAQKGFFVRFVLRRVESLICITGGLRDFYQKEGRSGRIFVLPSGVNLSQFENVPDIATVRQKYNVPLSVQVVGYIGKYKTMGEEKGVDDLIDVCGRLYQENKNILLFIVGLEQGEIEVVKEVCISRGLPETAFRLLPLIQKDFALYVQVADVLVMNYPNTEHYRNYMSPTKLFAYMGSGKAVIASDLPSVREVVDDSMATFFVPENSTSLRQALVETLSGDLDVTSSKVQKALQKSLSFSWENRSLQILSTLHSFS